MMPVRERVLVLRSVENFTGVKEDGLIVLAENAINREYAAGSVVTEAGDPQDFIQIVISGQLTVQREGYPALIVKERNGFGMLPAIAELPAGRTVADVETTTLEIPVSAFRIALEENFGLLRSALKNLAKLVSTSRHQLPANPEKPPKAEIGEYFEAPRTLVEQLIELRKGPFVHMNIDALVDMARRMVEVRVPAGSVFWKAGDPCTYALHVEYGRVRCTTPDGVFVDVGHDFTIGVMDLWGAQPRSYEARAETEIIAYRIEYEDFLVISEMHVSVAMDMLRGLARQYFSIPWYEEIG